MCAIGSAPIRLGCSGCGGGCRPVGPGITGLRFSVAGVLRFGGTYGSFTAALVLLVYLYLAAAGVLFGAEWNAMLAAESDRVDRSKPATR